MRKLVIIMVNKIYQMKNEILAQADKELNERGVERMDVDRLGDMIDMVHHLAEAESNCWQAEYYRTVTEAMKGEKSGYTQYMGETGRQGYAPGTGGTGSSAGYMPMTSGRQGYSDTMGFEETIDPLRTMMRNAKPDEREHMRNEVLKMIGAV